MFQCLSKVQLLRFVVMAWFASISIAAVHAEIRLPAIFANHMVVQRDTAVHVWGYATPGESVTVVFRGETKKTDADGLGRWSLYLGPGSAGGPFELVVEGTNRIALEDVLVETYGLLRASLICSFPWLVGRSPESKTRWKKSQRRSIRAFACSTFTRARPTLRKRMKLSGIRGVSAAPPLSEAFPPWAISSPETFKSKSTSRSESSVLAGWNTSRSVDQPGCALCGCLADAGLCSPRKTYGWAIDGYLAGEEGPKRIRERKGRRQTSGSSSLASGSGIMETCWDL